MVAWRTTKPPNSLASQLRSSIFAPEAEAEHEHEHADCIRSRACTCMATNSLAPNLVFQAPCRIVIESNARRLASIRNLQLDSTLQHQVRTLSRPIQHGTGSTRLFLHRARNSQNGTGGQDGNSSSKT